MATLVSSADFFQRILNIFSLNFLFTSAVGDLIPEEALMDEIQRSRFKNLNQFESMYIMADLKDEINLFSIKYRSSDGLLLIYPDLNNINVNPYLIEINFYSRNLYQFAIENSSMDCHNEITQLKNDIDRMTNRVKYTYSFAIHDGKCSILIVYFFIS